TGSGNTQHLDSVEEAPLVHADERRTIDQIRALDGSRIEAKVAHGHRTRFLRVVHEVGLHEQGAVLADDLRRVLVRTDRSVGTQSIEHGSYTGVVGREPVVEGEAGVCDVV